MPARLLAVLTALLCTSVLVSCGDDSTSSTDSTDSGSSSGGGGDATCEYPSDGAEPAKDVEPPAGEPTASGDVGVTISTSAGDVGATLAADAVPCTVNSFLSLADQGYYDDTTCHRLTTQGIFVLQCGDPTGSGAGGPGYSFPDELTGEESYAAGTLAMANAGPDTNGSQFFMVYDETQLDPNYTVFGSIDDAGLEVLRGVAAKGTANGAPDGPPAEQVLIQSVTVD
jgi:peptidyl-prolyl cis-trans isomerase B (cyclophilin B)